MIVLRPADISGPLLAQGNLCSSMLWGLLSLYDAKLAKCLEDTIYILLIYILFLRL